MKKIIIGLIVSSVLLGSNTIASANKIPKNTPKQRSEWLLKWYSSSEKKVLSSLYKSETQCRDKEALFRKAFIKVETSCTNFW